MGKNAQLWLAYVVAVAFAVVAALAVSSGHLLRALGLFASGALFVVLALRIRAAA